MRQTSVSAPEAPVILHRAGWAFFAILGVVVVAPRAGSQGVQVFPVGTLSPTNPTGFDNFGASISLQGNRVVVGAILNPSPSFTGSATIFERQVNGEWIEVAKLLASDGQNVDTFGRSVSLDGDRVLIGADSADNPIWHDAGAAYIFERQHNGHWLQTAKLTANDSTNLDNLGISVSLSGRHALAGAWQHSTAAGFFSGAAYVFERMPNGAWQQIAELVPSDAFPNLMCGASVSLQDGRALVGAPNANNPGGPHGGAVYVFERQQDGSWIQVAKIFSSDTNNFGSLGDSVSQFGDRVLAGAPNVNNAAGAAFIFERQLDGSWLQTAKLVTNDPATGDAFGESVSLWGDRALIGAEKDTNSAIDSGSAYLFERQPGGTWVQIARLVSPSPMASDSFGRTVSLFGSRLCIGAIGVDSSLGSSTGASYLFRTCDGCATPFGTGTAGCAGTETVGVSTAPEIGMASFALMCDNAPPSSLGLGLISSAPDVSGSDPFSIGVLLHVDVFASARLIAVDLKSNSTGHAVAPIVIPNNPALAGTTSYATALWAWTSCSIPPFNLSSAKGLALTILAP